MSIQVPSLMDQYPRLAQSKQSDRSTHFELPDFLDQSEQRTDQFPKTPKIPGLDLSDSHLSKSQFLDRLDCQLSRKHSYEALFLSHNHQLGDELTRFLSQKIAQDSAIKHLILTDTGLTNFAMAALADLLKVNHTIGWLVLNRNMIGDLGIDYLSKALSDNNHLIHLILADNDIRDQGVLALVDALTHEAEKKSLKSLFLQGNPLGPQSGDALIRLIKELPSLERLDIRDTGIPAAKIQEMQQVAGRYGVHLIF